MFLAAQYTLSLTRGTNCDHADHTWRDWPNDEIPDSASADCDQWDGCLSSHRRARVCLGLVSDISLFLTPIFTGDGVDQHKITRYCSATSRNAVGSEYWSRLYGGSSTKIFWILSALSSITSDFLSKRHLISNGMGKVMNQQHLYTSNVISKLHRA